jgi:hypothetical protein
MTEIETLALAIGHLRNADNLDPSVVPLEDTPGASLVTARSLLDQIPEKVAPVAWPILDSLIVEVG